MWLPWLHAWWQAAFEAEGLAATTNRPTPPQQRHRLCLCPRRPPTPTPKRAATHAPPTQPSLPPAAQHPPPNGVRPPPIPLYPAEPSLPHPPIPPCTALPCRAALTSMYLNRLRWRHSIGGRWASRMRFCTGGGGGGGASRQAGILCGSPPTCASCRQRRHGIPTHPTHLRLLQAAAAVAEELVLSTQGLGGAELLEAGGQAAVLLNLQAAGA